MSLLTLLYTRGEPSDYKELKPIDVVHCDAKSGRSAARAPEVARERAQLGARRRVLEIRVGFKYTV